MNKSSTAEFYRQHAQTDLLPFWNRALDHENGGVYTCFTNSGDRLVSTDKYIWSQGRFLWLWSRTASMISEKRLRGDAEPYLDHLHKSVRFLEKNAFLDNGNCAFVLTENGSKKESLPGKGFDTSIFADCFVVIGLSAYAALTRDNSRYETALTLYRSIRQRLISGKFRSEPYPVPEGYRSHSIPMIMLNVAQEMAETAEILSRPEKAEIFGHSKEYMNEIMEDFLIDGERIAEMLPADPGDRPDNDSLLFRHINPGHTIESMWFVMHTALKTGHSGYIQKAADIISKAVELGWDNEYGGLFRFADKDGGPPRGEKESHPFEQVITDDWHMKLWWPHSEALYTTMLARELTGDEKMDRLYQRFEDYVFKTFPNPDRKVGEWIQIRDRRGRPLDKIAALPVKDPFHILRNVLLILDLLDGKQTA